MVDMKFQKTGIQPNILSTGEVRVTPYLGSWLTLILEEYDLANDDWKFDNIPEIMDGKNIADFVDPDILKRFLLSPVEKYLKEVLGWRSLKKKKFLWKHREKRRLLKERSQCNLTKRQRI